MLDCLETVLHQLLSQKCKQCFENCDQLICSKCKNEFIQIHSQSLKTFELKDEKIIIHYLFEFKDTIREIIDRQKLSSLYLNQLFLKKCAEKTIPLFFQHSFHQPCQSLVWIPGHSLRPTHFVERWLLELNRIGWTIVNKPKIRRKLLYGKKTKTMNKQDRKNNDPINKFIYKNEKLTNVILVDDVMTTGTTIRKNIQILRSLGYTVNTALVLAYTPDETFVTF